MVAIQRLASKSGYFLVQLTAHLNVLPFKMLFAETDCLYSLSRDACEVQQKSLYKVMETFLE